MRKKAPQRPDRLSPSPPQDLMRMLIPPTQALDLVVTKTTANAVANATRQIGELIRDGLGQLACTDIITALAELDLRAKHIPADKLASVQATQDAIELAKVALAAAKQSHARAKAEILIALGYHDAIEKLGFSVSVVETAPSP